MADTPGSILAPGFVLSDRYKLEETLATGGTAQVWRGEDLILQRAVAIKLLHPHLAADPDIVERFRREAIAAARLSHPNIVPTFDTGTDRGATYIVLGLIDGPTLAEVLEKHTLTPLQACVLGRQIADALDHAHKNGLIHRDIKPSNVLLVDNDERAMVADFGIARVIAESIDPSATVPGVVLGTPIYFAPEQLNGSQPGPAIDIFALGILMHEMICGHSVGDVPTQHVTAIDASVPSLCPNLPSPIDAVITKASQQQPQDRYKTAGELCAALGSIEETLRKREAVEEPSASNPPTQSIPATKVRAPQPIAKPRVHRFDVTDAQSAARRRKLITVAIILTLVVAAILAGRYFGALSTNGSSSSTTTTTPASLTAASSFDPQGSDHAENQNQTRSAIDNNPSTSWSTETYSNRHFGNLKPGVGLAATLSAQSTLASVTVNSPSSDWSAEIYVSNNQPKALADWGNAVTAISGIQPGSTMFHIDGAKGSQVLLWITDLGAQNRVTISELTVQTR